MANLYRALTALQTVALVVISVSKLADKHFTWRWQAIAVISIAIAAAVAGLRIHQQRRLRVIALWCVVQAIGGVSLVQYAADGDRVWFWCAAATLAAMHVLSPNRLDRI